MHNWCSMTSFIIVFSVAAACFKVKGRQMKQKPAANKGSPEKSLCCGFWKSHFVYEAEVVSARLFN